MTTQEMTIPTQKKTLLVVLTEAVIETALLKDLDSLGLRGYTISDARGRGDRGVRNAAWGDAANIRLEIICAREQAEKLLSHLQVHYYEHYAMVTYLQDVEVLRPEKF
jgi:hypothetical protein